MCSTDWKRLLGQCFTPSAFDHALTGMKHTDLWVRIDWGDEQIARGNNALSLSSVSPSVALCPRPLSPSFAPPCISLCPCFNLSLSLPPSIPICLPRLIFSPSIYIYSSLSIYIYILSGKEVSVLFPLLLPPLSLPLLPLSKWVSQPSVKSSREL